LGHEFFDEQVDKGGGRDQKKYWKPKGQHIRQKSVKRYQKTEGRVYVTQEESRMKTGKKVLGSRLKGKRAGGEVLKKKGTNAGQGKDQGGQGVKTDNIIS